MKLRRWRGTGSSLSELSHGRVTLLAKRAIGPGSASLSPFSRPWVASPRMAKLCTDCLHANRVASTSVFAPYSASYGAPARFQGCHIQTVGVLGFLRTDPARGLPGGSAQLLCPAFHSTQVLCRHGTAPACGCHLRPGASSHQPLPAYLCPSPHPTGYAGMAHLFLSKGDACKASRCCRSCRSCRHAIQLLRPAPHPTEPCRDAVPAPVQGCRLRDVEMPYNTQALPISCVALYSTPQGCVEMVRLNDAFWQKPRLAKAAFGA